MNTDIKQIQQHCITKLQYFGLEKYPNIHVVVTTLCHLAPEQLTQPQIRQLEHFLHNDKETINNTIYLDDEIYSPVTRDVVVQRIYYKTHKLRKKVQN